MNHNHLARDAFLPLPAAGTAAAVFLVGFGAGDLSLVVLRWLAMLALPTVLFLLLLLVGMPIGGVLLIRIRRLRDADFPQIIALFGAISLLCIPVLLGALVVFQPPLPQPADLTEIFRNTAPGQQVHPPLPVVPMFAVLTLLPLFVGYGIVEFAAYRAGLAALRDNSGAVYALNLLGLLAAFVVHRLLLASLATTGLFFVGVAALALALLLLTPRRFLAAAALLVAGGLLFAPGLESRLLAALHFSSGPDSLTYWQSRCDRTLCDQWTPHCRLTMLEKDATVYGFYNGSFYWCYDRGTPSPDADPRRYQQLDLAFTRLIRPGDKVAVIGAGGGCHVAAALRAGAGQIVAVDVVPEMLATISGPLKDHFQGVYNDPRVRLVGKNGRRFFGETTETFDLVLIARLCSHVTGLRDLLEPSQLMFTAESFASIRPKLKPGGVLAIQDNLGLDTLGITFRQNFQELGRQGFKVMGYFDQERWKDLQAAFEGRGDPMPPGSYLIVAQPDTALRNAGTLMDAHLQGTSVERFDRPPPSLTPAHQNLTDDHAFATGLLIATVGYPAIFGAVGIMVAVLALLAWLLSALLRGILASANELSRPWLAAGAALVGFNFMTIEYVMVYRWMHHLDVTVDATFVGMVVFAGLAAAGGALLARLPVRLLLAVNALAALALLATAQMGPPLPLLAVLPASFTTGALFPRLLHGSDENLVRVYSWDAYGSLWGGLAALCVPLFLGFSAHQIVAGVFLVVTVALVCLSKPGPAAASGDAPEFGCRKST